MNNFIFTKKWKKIYDKLDDSSKNRIINKLKFLKTHKNIVLILKRLENFYPATHRLRIWNLRVILQKKEDNYYIIDLWFRWDVYK